MTDLTYYQRNRDMIINRAKSYYENDKKKLREQARGKNRNLSEEDKNEKREYGRNRYHNMSEEKKQKTKGVRKYNLFNFSTKPSIFATFRAKTSAHLQAVR